MNLLKVPDYRENTAPSKLDGEEKSNKRDSMRGFTT